MSSQINFDLNDTLDFSIDGKNYSVSFFFVIFLSINCRIYDSNKKRIGYVRNIRGRMFKDLFGKKRKAEIKFYADSILFSKENEGWSAELNSFKLYFKNVLKKKDIEVIYNSNVIGLIRYPVNPDKLNRATLTFKTTPDLEIVKLGILGFIGISNDKFLISISRDPFAEKDFWEKFY